MLTDKDPYKISRFGTVKSLEKGDLKTSPFQSLDMVKNKKVTIKVTCDHSIEKESLFFQNKIETKDLNNLTNANVAKVLSLDCKTIDYDEIPFETVPDSSGEIHFYSNQKNRLQAILKKYGVNNPHGLLKCSPKNALDSHKFSGELLRYVVDKKDEVWDVVLIDVWHLFATSDFQKNYRRFKHRGRFDLKELKKLG